MLFIINNILCIYIHMEEEKFIKNIGNKIKRIRKEIKKISQNELAVATGLGINTISNIETGRFPARLDTIYKIAKSLEVDPIIFLKHNEIDDSTLNIINLLLDKIKKMNKDELKKFLYKE
ncbi:MAG: helix-turn-helix transcriptional regulator [Rickettsiales bacterium]|nr:helix-turn-helix transcriptional regulator [Rickettsiales bacterium]